MTTRLSLSSEEFKKRLERIAAKHPYHACADVEAVPGVSDGSIPRVPILDGILKPKPNVHVGEVLGFHGYDFVRAATRILNDRVPTEGEFQRLAVDQRPWKKIEFLLELERENGKRRGRGRVEGVVGGRRLWRLSRFFARNKRKRLARWTYNIFRSYCRNLDKQLLLESSMRQLIVAGLAHVLNGGIARPKSTRKRVVLANFYPVWPPLGGGQRRIFFLARELSKTFDVEILAPERAGETKTFQLGANLREIRIACEPDFRELERLVDLQVKMASDVAYAAHWEKCVSYQKVLADRLALADIAITAHPYSIYALMSARGSSSLPLVFDSQNVEILGKAEILKQHPKYLAEVRSVEHTALAETQMTLACSTNDVDAFATEYCADASQIVLIENGVDALHVPQITEDTRARARADLQVDKLLIAVFAGSFHYPNLQAADVILNMAKKIPDVLFVFLGSICGYEKLMSTDEPNVVLLGSVDESSKWMLFNIADVGLNPMELGSGTNIKVLEYAAAGLAVVSTPFGVRGLDSNLVEAIRIAETAAFPEILSQIAQLPSATLRRSGAIARARVRNQSDWSVIGARYTASLNALLEGQESPALRTVESKQAL